MDFCLYPINNGMEICGNITIDDNRFSKKPNLCKIHSNENFHPFKNYNENTLCGHILEENEPIIPIKKKKNRYGFTSSSFKGKRCCFPKENGRKGCSNHGKKSIMNIFKNIFTGFKKEDDYKNECYYKYDLKKIMEKYPMIKNMSILNFCNLYCKNQTNNSNGLCHFHYDCQVCPCPKHKIDSQKKYQGILNHKLKNLILNEDIYSILFKFLNSETINLLNCTDKLHKNYKHSQICCCKIQITLTNLSNSA